MAQKEIFYFLVPRADFGQLLAEQFVEMAEFLGNSPGFTLVEVGAGSGILAKDILDYLSDSYADFYQNLSYIIVEQSQKLRERQRATLAGYSRYLGKVGRI